MLDLDLLAPGQVEHVCHKTVNFLRVFFLSLLDVLENVILIEEQSHQGFCVLAVLLHILPVVDATICIVEHLQFGEEQLFFADPGLGP
ncbi:hypothetical protein DSECCO2_593050 [anaerobic digester metagenome]